MERVLGVLFAVAGGYAVLTPESLRRTEVVPVSPWVYRFVGAIFLIGGVLLAMFGAKP